MLLIKSKIWLKKSEYISRNGLRVSTFRWLTKLENSSISRIKKCLTFKKIDGSLRRRIKLALPNISSSFDTSYLECFNQFPDSLGFLFLSGTSDRTRNDKRAEELIVRQERMNSPMMSCLLRSSGRTPLWVHRRLLEGRLSQKSDNSRILYDNPQKPQSVCRLNLVGFMCKYQ